MTSTDLADALQVSDRLLDSLGSATPPVRPNDWLVSMLLRWREAIESESMPEWVAA
jgi:uncharacterized protein YbjT (DUF2867 family)